MNQTGINRRRVIRLGAVLLLFAAIAREAGPRRIIKPNIRGLSNSGTSVAWASGPEPVAEPKITQFSGVQPVQGTDADL